MLKKFTLDLWRIIMKITKLAEHGLCYCASVRDDNTDFTEQDGNGDPTYARIRFESYAAAWRAGFINQLVLFGTRNETVFGKKLLVELGVSGSQILGVDTHVSTRGNAIVKIQWLTELGIKFEDTLSLTSGYHHRARYFADKEDPRLRFIPAESFLFAEVWKQTSRKCELYTQHCEAVFARLQREFHGSDEAVDLANKTHAKTGRWTFVERSIRDMQGISDDLGGIYKVLVETEQNLARD